MEEIPIMKKMDMAGKGMDRTVVRAMAMEASTTQNKEQTAARDFSVAAVLLKKICCGNHAISVCRNPIPCIIIFSAMSAISSALLASPSASQRSSSPIHPALTNA